jgi:hypothetical protein
MLQARGERTVLNLDAQEFEVLFVVRAREAVGANQRLAVDFEAHHRELAIFEAK